MGAYDGTEVCELAGLFLLNNLENKFDKNSDGLYRHDGQQADKICKEFYQLFKENGLSLEIECNLKIANYLDITLDLNNGTYKPYRQPNNEILYIHAKSNDPVNVLRKLPISIKTDYLTFPAILKFSMKHVNIIKIS